MLIALLTLARAVPVVADADGDGFFAPEDCDDFDASIHPGADDICDGVDQDCDGIVDDSMGGAAELLHPDDDGDGYGDPAHPQVWMCSPEGWVNDATDCDDGDPAVNPSATEIAGDGIDQDCDGADGAVGCSAAAVIPLGWTLLTAAVLVTRRRSAPL